MFNSGFRGKRATDNQGTISPQNKFVQTKFPVPTITSWSISGIDDTALSPAGGQTVLVNGTGFASGCGVTLNGATVSPVTFISATQISFTSPAIGGGTYSLVVYNTNGGAAILVPGVVYSSVPSYTTPAGSISSGYETKSISTSVTATSDSSVTYTLSSGSLPAGASLASNGTITGTFPVIASGSSTTYSFDITATDAEMQEVTRSFTLTSNIDVVTWVTPSSGATIQLDGTAYSQALSATDAASYSVSYTANALPTGLTLSSGTISGTPTVEGSTTTLLTATVATTNRSATNTVTWVVSLSEPLWKYMTLLISANASTAANSFNTDSSVNNLPLTVVGDTRAHKFNPFQFGYYSVNFTANGQYLTGSHPSFNVSSVSTAWTFECWVYPVTAGHIFAIGAGTSWSNSIAIDWGQTTANKFNMSQGNGSSAPVNFGTTNTYPANRWYHLAVTRTAAGVNTIYVNGVADGTATYTAAGFSSGTTFVVNGTYDNNGLGANGSAKYISNLRFSIGRVVYTGAFTPSTTPLSSGQDTLLLLCQANRFVETSQWHHAVTVGSTPAISQNNPFTSQYQITDPGSSYSYFFNGSSYLTIASSPILSLGTTWTIECWIYPTSTAKQQIINLGSTSLYIESVSGFNLSKWTNAGGNGGNYGGNLVANAWNHIAWQATNDGSIRGFINGTVALVSGWYDNAQSAVIIGSSGSSMYYNGYMSNLRIVKGTALYTTTDFAPPTAPLTAITNTVLLTCQSSTIVDNSSSAFTLTPTGTVTPTPFYPSIYSSVSATPLSTSLGSGYFDGTGDYLSTPYNPVFYPGTSDFTIEFWMYHTNWLGGYGPGIGMGYKSTPTGGWIIYRNTVLSNGMGFRYATQSGASMTDFFSTSVPQSNQWEHWALVRSGSTIKWYRNGVQDNSAAISVNITDTDTTTLMYVGYSQQWTYYFGPGYLADVRYVKGTALYTSNFVPGYITPLTNIANTQLLTLQSNKPHNNSSFTDSSAMSNVITRAGNVTNGTFSPFGDSWSTYVSASNYCSVTSSTILTASTSTFTIEAWVYLTSDPVHSSTMPGLITGDVSGSLNYFSFGVYGTTRNVGMYWYGSNGFSVKGTSVLNLNTWYHVATSVNANAIKIFVNGVEETLQGTTLMSNRGGVSGAWQVGNYNANTTYITGYVSNVRVVSGTSLYNSSFTVPAAPLQAVQGTSILLASTSQLNDLSMNNYSVSVSGTPSIQRFSPFSTKTVPKYYSTKFNGSTDFLSIADSTALRVNTSDFTVEGWLYKFDNASSMSVVTVGPTTSAGAGAIFYSPDTRLGWYTGQGTGILSDTTDFPLNQWVHFAFVRSGTTLSLYVNGTFKTSAAWSTAWNPSGGNVTYIGKWIDGTSFLYKGYISNLRIVNGTALYSANFTPSTSPLTAISNTALLACQDSTFIDNSSNKFTITAGTTTVKPLLVSPFTPTASTLPVNYSTATFGGSMYFDGSGDYLTVGSNSSPILFNTTTTNWTIQCWYYWPTSASASNPVLAVARNSSGTAKFGIYWASNNYIYVTDITTHNAIAANVTMPLGQWVHLAIVNISSTIKVYINGIMSASSANNLDSTDITSWEIGAHLANSWYSTIYFTDIMLTRTALYTSNFYPGSTPATPTTTIGTTTYKSSLLLNGTSGAIVDQTRTVDFETVGDTKLVNFTPFHGNYYSYNIPSSGSSIGFTQPALGNVFTIEMWIFPTTVESNNFMYMGLSTGPIIGYNSTTFSAAHQGTWTVAASANPTVGTWSHIALVREGTGSNQFKLYLNGTLVGTGTDATTFGSQSAVIGGNANASYTGYIHSLRVVNNQALYTGSFTPATSPLTSTLVGSTGAGAASSITGTVALLTMQNKTIIDNSPSPLTLTPNGSIFSVGQNPFQVNTGASCYFDGTGDYLVTWNILPFAFNTGDLTMEAWIYRSDSGVQRAIIDTRGSSSVGILFYVANEKLSLFDSSSTYLTSTNTVPVGLWVHVAVSRSSGTTKLFINGALEATLANDTRNYQTNSVGGVMVGRQYGSTSNDWYGYMADIRVTTGNARYTATFTAPTLPMRLS